MRHIGMRHLGIRHLGMGRFGIGRFDMVHFGIGHLPSSCGFMSLIEWHIETHIEDGFPVSSGFVCLNETHSEE